MTTYIFWSKGHPNHEFQNQQGSFACKHFNFEWACYFVYKKGGKSTTVFLYNSNFLTKSSMGNSNIPLSSLFVMFCFFFLNFTVAKDLAKLARNDKSQLRRRHSITLCESRNRKSSTDSNTSTEVLFLWIIEKITCW